MVLGGTDKVYTMLTFKLTGVVFPCVRGYVNIVRSWKIVGSTSVYIRRLPSVRHLATQHDKNTRFEKVRLMK